MDFSGWIFPRQTFCEDVGKKTALIRGIRPSSESAGFCCCYPSGQKNSSRPIPAGEMEFPQMVVDWIGEVSPKWPKPEWFRI